MRVLGIDNKIAFSRRPKADEERDLKATIDSAYKIMGTTDRVVITHGSCFPSSDYNSYIGSPYGTAAKEYIKFLQLYGFNGNQLGPGGELEMREGKLKTSPYNSSAFAKNRLFIDLEELTTPKYGQILSKETLEKTTSLPNISDKNYDMSDFNEALRCYDKALKESYQTFKTNLSKGQPEAISLNKEFRLFLQKHNERLTDEGMFRVLAKHYNTDKFEKWGNELDKNLIVGVNNGDIDSIERYNEILHYNNNEIEQYKFEQFIATKQIKENKQWRNEHNFKYINDLLIGCSKMDEWRYKEAFLENYSVGSYESSGHHQVWGIPAIDPRKLFKGPDMELNIGGKFLKEKIDFALEFCENLRVDHALGLVDPFLIKKDSIFIDENEIDYSKIEGFFVSNTVENGEKLDDYYNYPRILEKIVLPAFKEHGLEVDTPLWESICSNPIEFQKIYHEKLNLPELTQLEWAKAENQDPRNWFLVGSHDSIPAAKMIEREWTKNSDAWNPLYLAGYLNQDPKRADDRDKLCDLISDKIGNTKKEGNALKIADKERVKAKFAELLTTKKFEISFADLLGITDMTYNIGGVHKDDNWKVRISPDYIEKYYKNLSSDSPTALNIPEILKMALQAKMDMAIVHSPDKNKTREELYIKYQPILDKLQKYADILKEPEE